jgi:hypothetical protein
MALPAIAVYGEKARKAREVAILSVNPGNAQVPGGSVPTRRTDGTERTTL